MSKRADRNRKRRWDRKTRVDHQARTRVAHEMAQMGRMMDEASDFVNGLVFSAMEQMAGEQRRRHNAEAHGRRSRTVQPLVGALDSGDK